MIISWKNYIQDSSKVFKDMDCDEISQSISKSIEIIVSSLKNNKPLLVCGNGGSASDAMHITGELVGRFMEERKALNVISLSSNPAIMTAWANDYNYETVFSRQVEAHGLEGASIICISTSGKSRNVILAAEASKKIGMKVISMTGESGGDLNSLSDSIIKIPSKSVPLIQQGHLIAYHYLCLGIEKSFT